MTTPKKRRKKRRLKIIIVVLVIFVVLAITIAGRIANQNSGPEIVTHLWKPVFE